MNETSNDLINESNNYFECKYKNIFCSEINPNIEILRSESLFKILSDFIQIVTNRLGIEIFSIKKNYIRTLTNIFSSWLFVQYSRNDCDKDPIIPSGEINYDTLKITLIDMMKYDSKIDIANRNLIADSIINELNLKNSCLEEINKIKNYVNSDIYKKNSAFKIIKILKIKKRKKELGDYEYYQFKLSSSYKSNNENVIKIMKNMKVSKEVYDKLNNKFNIYIKKFDMKYDIDLLIWCMLFRYITIGSHNHQLAVIPKVMNILKNEYKLNIELFASGINHYLGNYCSIFYDIEKYFGSFGSFFNITPVSGLFGFNPPYENYIMEKGVKKILNHLDKSEQNGKKLGFIVTIPIWDKEGKTIMENEFGSKPGKNMKIDYGDYNTIKMINESKYLKFKKMIPKYNFSYLDYFNMIYKDKTIQNTYVILLTNSFYNIDTKILSEIDFKNK